MQYLYIAFSSEEQENELSGYTEQSIKLFYGLLIKDVRKLVYDLDTTNNIRVEDV